MSHFGIIIDGLSVLKNKGFKGRLVRVEVFIIVPLVSGSGVCRVVLVSDEVVGLTGR